jgi:hypothetical protein
VIINKFAADAMITMTATFKKTFVKFLNVKKWGEVNASNIIIATMIPTSTTF